MKQVAGEVVVEEEEETLLRLLPLGSMVRVSAQTVGQSLSLSQITESRRVSDDEVCTQ